MNHDDRKIAPTDKDSVKSAPEAGEPTAGGVRTGNPVGSRKDDVRNAPESGDRTRDEKESTSK